jgi:cytoskeletal protein RodZ
MYSPKKGKLYNQINSYFSSLVVIAILVAGLISIENSIFAQKQTGSTSSNPNTNDSQSQIEQLNKTMAELESSNNPQDIVTLAYI